MKPSFVLSFRWLALATACLLGRSVGASDYLETDDFADAVTAVEGCVSRFGAEETLLVVDIDNTLLTMRGDLGSDSWFEWQEYLLAHDPDSPDLVADSFTGLLEAQGLLFKLGQMKPSQPDLPQLVKRIQQLGVPTLVLTSRGPEFRHATERELAAAGYDFAKTVLATSGFSPGEFLPYDPVALADVGLTARDARAYRLGTPRPVSFENGVMMVAGQHKGALLVTVLNRAKQPPKAVVFIDDHGRHVHRVFDALTRRDIETIALHYKRLDDQVARFRYSDKSVLTERWRRLDAALKEVFSLPGEAAAEPAGEPVAVGN